MIRPQKQSLRLHTGDRDSPEGELQTSRHATWLELFFDLVFVAGIIR